MVGVIICTHGNSAGELLKSAEMICGEQKNCATVSFKMGESLDKLKKNLTDELDQLTGPIICLTDLKGGTPFNTLVNLTATYPDLEIITGVNIPMMLQLFINREILPNNELVESAIEAGTTGIYRYQSELDSDDDEEF